MENKELFGRNTIKLGQIVRVKDGMEPLYTKRDKFKIVNINKNPDLMPFVALNLRTKKTYGFFEEELENENRN